MARTGTGLRRGWRGFGAIGATVGLGLAVSGCAYSLSEFAGAPKQQPAVLTGVTPEDAAMPAIPLKPAALVEEGPAATPPASSEPRAAATDAPGSYPNINAVPDQPKSKLLSPEEKARVIVELEALAKAQGPATATARKIAKSECDQNAAMVLDPEEQLRREKAGLKC